MKTATKERVFDLCLAMPALLVAILPLAFAASAIFLTLGQPVLFKQVRLGKDKKPFVMYKIRTMTNKRDASSNLLPDLERLTTLGQFLRHYAIDELPQLYNIIKGDMSFIGPRPMVARTDIPSFDERHAVRPGLFSLAKINEDKFSDPSLENRINLDLQQINERSLTGNIKIIFHNLANIVTGKHDPFTRPATREPLQNGLSNAPKDPMKQEPR